MIEIEHEANDWIRPFISTLIVLFLLDAGLTYIAMSLGVAEANVLMAYVLDKFGFFGLTMLKVIISIPLFVAYYQPHILKTTHIIGIVFAWLAYSALTVYHILGIGQVLMAG